MGFMQEAPLTSVSHQYQHGGMPLSFRKRIFGFWLIIGQLELRTGNKRARAPAIYPSGRHQQCTEEENNIRTKKPMIMHKVLIDVSRVGSPPVGFSEGPVPSTP
eukprot:1139474-Pelagomonas_calceolata.AAC.3